MIRKPPVLDPAHPGDGNYLPGRCSLSCALIFFSARMSRIFFCLSPDTANTKLQLSSFVFPLSRAEAAALPLPPPPAALGSAGPRSRPYPGPGSSGGRSGDALPLKDPEDARGLSARIRAGIQTSHLHYKAGREIGLARRSSGRPSAFPALRWQSAQEGAARRYAIKLFTGNHHTYSGYHETPKY